MRRFWGEVPIVDPSLDVGWTPSTEKVIGEIRPDHQNRRKFKINFDLKIYIDFDALSCQFWKVLGGQNRFFWKGWEFRKMPPTKNSELQKNVIFLRKNAIFHKIDDFSLTVEINEKYEKSENKSLQNLWLFRHAFSEDFAVNLVGFWDPSWAPTSMSHWGFFEIVSKWRPNCAKNLQGCPKSVPRASQERPGVSQECPGVTKKFQKASQEPPKRAQGTPKVPPEVLF